MPKHHKFRKLPPEIASLEENEIELEYDTAQAYEGEIEGEDDFVLSYSEVEGGDECQSEIPQYLVSKPQIWVRIRPNPCCDNNVFDISDDLKTMKLIVEPVDRIMQRKTGKITSFKFLTDGILKDSTQPETYKSFVEDLVNKSMDGICGAVICVGPEVSGKSYSLFGSQGKYENRGMIFRALEYIFEIAETSKGEKEYHIILSMFEIRRDKIKDLLTLGDYDLKQVGEFGPKGLFYEEIFTIEQAINLILRGNMGQKLFPRESYAKPHTIVYIDIICKPLPTEQCKAKRDWRSRITFAKIASLPQRDKPKKYPNVLDQSQLQFQNQSWTTYPCSCNIPYDQQLRMEEEMARQREQEQQDKTDEIKRSSTCCKLSGELTEGINVRKDFSFLEQMFIRAHDLRKISNYYAKLQSLGMYMLMKPPKLAPSQYFRQSKLAHSLKDIVTGKTEIRVLLHVRPERDYLQSTLEAMRFAERARCIPSEPLKKSNINPKDQSFEERISHMCQELGIEDTTALDNASGLESLHSNFPHLNAEKMKEIMSQATSYFEEKLDTLEGGCKEQVKNMFETFQEMWMRLLENIPNSENLVDESAGEELEDEDQDIIIPESTQTDELTGDNNSHHSKRHSNSGNSQNPNGLSGTIKDKDKKKPTKEPRSRSKKIKVGRRSSLKIKSKTNRDQGSKNTDGEPGLEYPESQIISQLSIDDKNKGGSMHVGISEELAYSQNNIPPEVEIENKLLNEASSSGSKPDDAKSGSDKNHDRMSIPLNNYDLKKSGANPLSPNTHNKNPEHLLSTDGNENTERKSVYPVEGLQKRLSQVDNSIKSSTNESNSQHGHQDMQANSDVPFKHEAWEGFSNSEAGSKIITKFKEKQTILKNSLLEHNEVQKEISNLIAKLTHHQMDLDLMEQERQLKGGGIGITSSGTTILPSTSEEHALTEIENLQKSKDSLLIKLQNLRSHLQINKISVEECKKESEEAFNNFCSEKYHKIPNIKPYPLSTLKHATSGAAVEVLGFILTDSESIAAGDNEPILSIRDLKEEEISKKFDQIKRMARKQAKELLSFYPKRPRWMTLYTP